MHKEGGVLEVILGHLLCDEDSGGQHDAGHECVVTGRDAFSIRSYIPTTAGAPRQTRLIIICTKHCPKSIRFLDRSFFLTPEYDERFFLLSVLLLSVTIL